MAAYEQWFAGKDRRRAILRLMGLFDRPAEAGAIAALRAAPVPRLTEARLTATKGLHGLVRAPSWQRARLEPRRRQPAARRLLAERDPQEPDTPGLPTPCVREHFGEQLQRDNPAAWREGAQPAVRVLQGGGAGMPDTLEEMAPLYAAVAHGCQAGRHQEALDEVYWRRILRGEEFSVRQKLGAFGADLAALSGFFDPPWRGPSQGWARPTRLLS